MMTSFFFALAIFSRVLSEEYRGVTDWTIGGGSAPPFRSTDHKLKPNGNNWGILTAPFPTNQAWGGAYLDDGALPYTAAPYIYESNNGGLTMSYGKISGSAGTVFWAADADLIFSAKEGMTRRIVDYDLGSWAILWRKSWNTNGEFAGLEENGQETNAPQKKPSIQTGNPTDGMLAHIVPGAAYTTVKYGGVTPQIKVNSAIQSVNGGQTKDVSGSKFNLVIGGKSFILYVLNGSLNFSWDTKAFTCKSTYTGAIRIAYCDGAATETALDKYKGCFPIACKISYSVSGDTATYKFSWITEGSGSLLMMALPHQREILKSPQYESFQWECLKGKMKPVVGDTWQLVEPLTTVGFDGKRGIASNRVNDIKNALAADRNNQVGIPGDTYWFGKAVARYGRLARIAGVLGDSASKNDFIGRMKNILNPWLDKTNPDTLLYDQSWGGIISINGLNDPGAEYGQGYYNDHHFHWGYFVYAAAVIADADAEWGKKYKSAVEALIRDYANPSTNDNYFSLTRSKDWYAGHSWANGLFAFRDGKNQESTSEAINGYYAVYLWGLAMKDNNIRDWGRLLVATEIRSTRWYWHTGVSGKEAVYPDVFAKNTCVGILWSTKVDYATWFGANPEYIHGIQMMPFTPISEEYLEADWIRKEWDVVKNISASQEWRGMLVLARSQIDKDAAWNEIINFNTFDSGNSKTNSLYFIATRP